MNLFAYIRSLCGLAIAAPPQRPFASQTAPTDATATEDVDGDFVSKIVQAPVPTRGTPTSLSSFTYTRGHTAASNQAIVTQYLARPVVDDATDRRAGYETDGDCLPVVIACQCLGLDIPEGCKFAGKVIPDKRGVTYWCSTQLHMTKEAVVSELEAAEVATGVPHQLLRESLIGHTFTHGTKKFDGHEVDWQEARKNAVFVSKGSRGAADKFWKAQDAAALADAAAPPAATGPAAATAAANVTPSSKAYGLNPTQQALFDQYAQKSKKPKT